MTKIAGDIPITVGEKDQVFFTVSRHGIQVQNKRTKVNQYIKFNTSTLFNFKMENYNFIFTTVILNLKFRDSKTFWLVFHTCIQARDPNPQTTEL